MKDTITTEEIKQQIEELKDKRDRVHESHSNSPIEFGIRYDLQAESAKISREITELQAIVNQDWKDHPLITILEGLGCIEENNWEFEYKDNRRTVNRGYVEISASYDDDAADYQDLMVKILADYYSGKNIDYITPVKYQPELEEELRTIKKRMWEIERELGQ